MMNPCKYVDELVPSNPHSVIGDEDPRDDPAPDHRDDKHIMTHLSTLDIRCFFTTNKMAAIDISPSQTILDNY